MSEEKKEGLTETKVSRRSMLKWVGALGTAAAVGAVAEYGASELLKPLPPPPVSFKPPLSPEVQQKVTDITKQLIARRSGDQIVYTNCKTNGCIATSCVLKVHIKDGVVTGVEPDDSSVNPNDPREDVGLEGLKKGRISRLGQAGDVLESDTFP